MMIVFMIFLAFTFGGQAEQSDFPILKGPYLGQKPPGKVPEKFAPGLVSAAQAEFNAAFSPDGREFYYSVWQPSGRETMMGMQRREDRWSPPVAPPFVGPWSDCDPFFSRDGKRLYFISTRPKTEGGKPGDWDIWYVERDRSDWSGPVNIGPPINSASDEYYVSLSDEGTLYFASDRPGGYGSFDIYRSRFAAGRYAIPENLGRAINTGYLEQDPFVAPDESYLVFTSVGRPDGIGQGDLYISFHRKDGTWTEAKNMGRALNTGDFEFCTMASPDGKYFFFTRKDDVYWVSAEVIEDLRPRTAKKEESIRLARNSGRA